MVASSTPRPTGFLASGRWAGYALGFSIGGFFDGILLHQVLQWHHLLSGLEGGRFDDLRFQILADGLFHLLMFVVGGVGLWLLWRARREFSRPGADRLLLANALIGFGAWHVIDGIVSHWLLRIHWIRMDSDMPLVWDILWFAVFGVAFLGSGLMLKAGKPRGGRGMPSTPAAVAALAVLSGAATLFAPSDADGTATLVVFRPGIAPAEAMAAVAGAGARLIWSDENDGVWAVDLPEGADRLALYRSGALLVSDSLLPAGCLGWFRRAGEGEV